MARPLGTVTRGTTATNRLRRVDRWLVATYASALRSASDPLVVDLGYGASAWTTVELRGTAPRGARRTSTCGASRSTRSGCVRPSRTPARA